MRKLDLSGQRFGRLTAISEAGRSTDGRVTWLCNCDCGNSAVVTGKHLRLSLTRSCGCLHKESSIQNLPKTAKVIGAERKTRKGYIEVKTDRGYVRKHVHVMEQHIGRMLARDEVVHHIDQNKLNNDISNLQLMTHAEHTALHNRLSPVSKETGRKIARALYKYSYALAKAARELVASGMSQRSVAERLGMSQMAVSRIVRNLTYTEQA